MGRPASSANCRNGTALPMARRTVAPSACRLGKTAGAPLPRARRWLSWGATGAGGGASSVCSALG
eukprot:13547333-Alexandrium_andersonii.AAC.1